MTSRTLAAANVTQIDSRQTHPVAMAKMEFSVPIYLHSGLGTILWDGDNYLGVGTYGGVSGVEETEAIVPSAITLQLSGLSQDLFDEALNSSNYGDLVTLFVGYRDDDGSLVADPYVFYKGHVEKSGLQIGDENSVNVIIQHELAVLRESIGTKFTDEDQQRKFPGDTAFSRVEQVELVKLDWGSRPNSGSGGGGGQPGPDIHQL
jgi:hypothetical protein